MAASNLGLGKLQAVKCESQNTQLFFLPQFEWFSTSFSLDFDKIFECILVIWGKLKLEAVKCESENTQ